MESEVKSLKIIILSSSVGPVLLSEVGTLVHGIGAVLLEMLFLPRWNHGFRVYPFRRIRCVAGGTALCMGILFSSGGNHGFRGGIIENVTSPHLFRCGWGDRLYGNFVFVRIEPWFQRSNH